MADFTSLSVSIGQANALFLMSDQGGMDHVVQQANLNGLAYYEPPLPTILMALAQEADGVFLDIGANTGVYSLLTATANPVLSVYAFEPVRDIGEMLHNNIKLNPSISHQVNVVAAALSNGSGHVTMQHHINPHGMVATSSTLEANLTNSIEYNLIDVERTSLNQWCAVGDIRKIAFAKIDVEGHEKSVVEGAIEIVGRDRPFLAIELLGSADFDFFTKFARDMRYIDIALRPNQALRLATPRFMPDAWNHLFCPIERSWDFAKTCYRVGLPIG